MTKICFISPSLSQGGLENAVVVVANEFADLGYEVSIICIYNNPIFYKLRNSVNIISPIYSRKQYLSMFYYLKSIVFVRNEVSKIKPNVIISYGDYINFISIIATRFLRIPVFISDRSSPNKKFPFAVDFLRRRTYGQSDGIIAQTERAKIQKIKMLSGYKNIEVIPNPLRKIVNYADIEKENIILAVGRHYDVKGLDRLLRAYAQVKTSNWKIVIAGSAGPQTEDLKTLAAELNLSNDVEFLGAVKEIDKIFAKSKIYVLPSRSEGFPNALIEAMAHGLPCVAFDVVAGPAEIINNGINGILIPDGDITAMAHAIKLLMENKDLRNSVGKEALRVNEELSVTTITRKFLEFLKIEPL